jgi:hypothetical protein
VSLSKLSCGAAGLTTTVSKPATTMP